MHTICPFVAGLATFVSSVSAHAEESSPPAPSVERPGPKSGTRTIKRFETQRAYSYEFDDDDLLGSMTAPNGSDIRVRRPGSRVMLLRPRVQFVREMLKSVEDL